MFCLSCLSEPFEVDANYGVDPEIVRSNPGAFVRVTAAKEARVGVCGRSSVQEGLR